MLAHDAAYVEIGSERQVPNTWSDCFGGHDYALEAKYERAGAINAG